MENGKSKIVIDAFYTNETLRTVDAICRREVACYTYKRRGIDPLDLIKLSASDQTCASCTHSREPVLLVATALNNLPLCVLETSSMAEMSKTYYNVKIDHDIDWHYTVIWGYDLLSY